MKILKVAGTLLSDFVYFRARAHVASHVALTFDDGPHPDGTPRILDALDRAQVKATFFFQGDHGLLHPEIVRETHARGHQVGLHGMQHISAKAQSEAAVLENAERCHATLSEIVGSELRKDFRPPYGDMTLAALRRLRSCGYRLIYWSYDSEDSFVSNSDQVLARLRNAPPSAGSIVLFHDDYSHTVTALPEAIGLLRMQGMALDTVSVLCGND